MRPASEPYAALLAGALRGRASTPPGRWPRPALPGHPAIATAIRPATPALAVAGLRQARHPAHRIADRPSQHARVRGARARTAGAERSARTDRRASSKDAQRRQAWHPKQETPCRPTSIRAPDFACRCPTAKTWTRPARTPMTAAPSPAPPSPACKDRPASSSTARRRRRTITAINRYLRFEAGFTPHVREVAILTTAREMDSQFEWVAHEPEALKEGVPQNVIDVIKHRRATAGLDETDATVIELGRQTLARSQGQVGNLRQGQGHLRAEQAGRAGHADGELRWNRGSARRRRHAIARRQEAAAADPIGRASRAGFTVLARMRLFCHSALVTFAGELRHHAAYRHHAGRVRVCRLYYATGMIIRMAHRASEQRLGMTVWGRRDQEFGTGIRGPRLRCDFASVPFAAAAAAGAIAV